MANNSKRSSRSSSKNKTKRKSDGRSSSDKSHHSQQHHHRHNEVDGKEATSSDIKHWDVRISGSTKRMIRGHFLPTFSGKFVSKKVRLVIELVQHYNDENLKEKEEEKEEEGEEEDDETSLFSKSVGSGGGSVVCIRDEVANSSRREKKKRSRRRKRSSMEEKSVRNLEANALGENDQVLFRVEFPSTDADNNTNEEEEEKGKEEAEGRHNSQNDGYSSDGSSDYSVDSDYSDEEDEDEEVDGSKWYTKYRVSLAKINVVNIRPTGRKLFLTVGHGHAKKGKNVFFQTHEDALSFIRVFLHMKNLMHRRSQAIFQNLLGTLETTDNSIPNDGNKKENEANYNGCGVYSSREAPATASTQNQHCRLLIEIVSASEILPIDKGIPPSPFCCVRLGDTSVHKTSTIHNTFEPIWTMDTKSLFLINIPLKRFCLDNDGLTFHLFHYAKRSTGCPSLGFVTVPHGTLLHANGERMVFPLTHARSEYKEKDHGTIAIRCRTPTVSDMEFLSSSEQRRQQKLQSYAMDAIKSSRHGPTTNGSPSYGYLKAIAKTLCKKKISNASSSPDSPPELETVYRVKPYPDPNKPKEVTEFLSEGDMKSLCMEPSTHWIEAGSGDLGVLFLEVLGCKDLPNMDVIDKTDAFVRIIHEDAIVQTEVIFDCLSPLFMPWTRRAFMFHITKNMSHLFLGVFDYDKRSAHDSIGRVSVPVGTFAPNTEYILEYNLYTSHNLSTRTSRGTITIRLSVEYNDIQKRYLSSCFEPKHRFHVNMAKKKDFDASVSTLEGTPDTHTFRLDTIVSYVEEITSYGIIYFKIEEAMKCVFLWRGHCRLQIIPYIAKCYIVVPLHSMIAFTISVLCLECPDLRPSLFFGCIAWFMLALLEDQRRSASPFQCPRSYPQMLSEFVYKKPIPVTIRPKGTDKPILTKEQEQAAITLQEKITLWKKWWEENCIQGERMGPEWDIENVTTKTSSPSNIITKQIKGVFYPHQLMLYMWCVRLRYISSILSWEHCYISFWITTISIVLSVGLAFFPWNVIFLWTSRFVVWAFLGPWMKLLDIFYFRKFEELSYAEREAEMLRRKRQYFSDYMHEIQIRKEDVQQLAAVKKHIFGEYIVSVPDETMMDRYRDAPLSTTSSAKPLEEGEKMSQVVRKSMRTKIPGQRMQGTMIPHTIEEEEEPEEDSASSRIEIFSPTKGSILSGKIKSN